MRSHPWIILAALLLIACISCQGGSDASETCSDGSVYGYETHGSGHPDYYCVITSAEADAAVLHLPSVLEGYDVRIYSSHAFDGCTMESAIIPKNLREIEDGAFAGCTFLKDAYFMGDRPVMGDPFPDGVRIHTVPGAAGWTDTEAIDVLTVDGVDYAMLPDGAVATGGVPTGGTVFIRAAVDGTEVVKVDDYAFAGTMQEDGTVDRRSDIDTVVMPEGLRSIGQRAFYYNDVSEARIPGTVADVQDEAFRACYNLADAGFSGNLRYIGFEAFRDCHLIRALDVPASVEFVGDGAFYICEGLETLRVGTDIAPRMFGYCVSLKDVEFGGSVGEIGASSFYLCESLASVEIPEKVRGIGREAFRGCISLKNLDLNGTEDIGRMAFRGCMSLGTLTVPAAVGSIEGYAFADCTGLKEIYAYGTAPKGDDTAFLNVDAVIHCKKDAVDSWKDSGFGLEVAGDLDGDPFPMAIISVAAIAAVLLSLIVIMRLRRDARMQEVAERKAHSYHRPIRRSSPCHRFPE